MKTIYRKQYYLILSLIAAFFLSCEKFVEIDPAVNLVETGKIFSSEKTTEASILGLYEFMRSANFSLTNGGLSLYHALGADELEPLIPNQNYEEFYNNSISVNNGAVNLLWGAGYRMLYRTNAIIEGVEQSSELLPSYKSNALAEVRFLRAFYHFLLLNNFGDIPLVISASYSENMLKGRESAESVFQTIVDDLLFAVDNLHDDHASMGIFRANKWAAIALLARVYLYLEDWQGALSCSRQIMESSKYSLTERINEVFLPDSKENIWAISSQYSNTAEASIFIPANSIVTPSVKLTDKWINEIDESDPRWTNWVNVWTSSDGEHHYYPFKYKNNAFTPVTEQLIALRFAEQYLIQAETLWRLKQPDDALIILNVLRRSRGASPIEKPHSDDQWLEVILSERKMELFCEWGHRWFDLRRLSLLDDKLSAIKAGWKTHAKNLPIPESELLINVYLKQNEGYN